MNKKSGLIIIIVLFLGIGIGAVIVLRTDNAETSTSSNSKSVESVVTPDTNTAVSDIPSIGNTNVVQEVIDGSMFISPNLGYSAIVPDGWNATSYFQEVGELPLNGVDDDYIMNEEVGAPLEMTEDGVWITVERFITDVGFEDFIAQQAEEKEVSDRTELSINGLLAVWQREVPLYPTEAGYDVYTYINAGDYYYTFSILTRSREKYSQNEDEIISIVNSFDIL